MQHTSVTQHQARPSRPAAGFPDQDNIIILARHNTTHSIVSSSGQTTSPSFYSGSDTAILTKSSTSPVLHTLDPSSWPPFRSPTGHGPTATTTAPQRLSFWSVLALPPSFLCLYSVSLPMILNTKFTNTTIDILTIALSAGWRRISRHSLPPSFPRRPKGSCLQHRCLLAPLSLGRLALFHAYSSSKRPTDRN